MKDILKAVLAAMPLMIIPASIRGGEWSGDDCSPGKCSHIKQWVGKIAAKAGGYVGELQISTGKGPWYSYWPYNSHFMTPAPQFGCHYPYWSPGGVSGGFGSAGVTAYVPGGMEQGHSPGMALPSAGYSIPAPVAGYPR
ncbi:MAG TPA: hypothetical protein VGY77_10190 [Gemmataceae bacterium]|nr:hypothetical protein [Gemmataceae bacterium]